MSTTRTSWGINKNSYVFENKGVRVRQRSMSSVLEGTTQDGELLFLVVLGWASTGGPGDGQHT